MNKQERIAFVKAQGAKWTGVQPKALKYPFVLEKNYADFLKRLLRPFIIEVRNKIEPVISQAVKVHKSEMKLDSADVTANLFESQIQSIQLGYEHNQFMEQASKINRNQKLQQDMHFKKGLGIVPIMPEAWLVPLLKDFAVTNAMLIRAMQEKYLSDVRKTVVINVSAGMSVETIKQKIVAISGTTLRHAETIARTETGKLFGGLTKARNQAIGINDFIWFHTTLLNPRIQHLQNDGKKFNWDKGDINGDIPGSLFNCRCTSASDFSAYF
jgi:SPP1 gp7 family putative phage head morphogenesis protein